MGVALADINVIDFTWALAGPLITRFLAAHGATVVRIESGLRPDSIRTSSPFKDHKPGINRSGYFAYLNPNKYGMSINLKHAEMMKVMRKLISWGDVVVENFAPGVMESFGLGYEDIKKLKPDIVMVRASGQGQTGPLARHPGFGHHIVALTGFCYYSGWPDREPAALSTAYTDGIIPRFATAALVAALAYRRRTGKGQLLDLGQLETGIHFQAPAFLDYCINKRVGNRTGNQSPFAAPHGVYRCLGKERWCAIAIFNEHEWESFCNCTGNPSWTKDPRFHSLLRRKENEAALNELIEQWTIQYSAEEVMRLLQSAGIAAGIVQNAEDICRDPQLKERDNLWVLHHQEMGDVTHLGSPFLMSETPAQSRMAAPRLGEHTEYICKEFLKMTGEEYDKLLVAGVFE